MQTRAELREIIRTGLPGLNPNTVELWVDYLKQLKGCHLYSVDSPEKDKKAWLRSRRAGIGGSEIAAILGENHWNSPRQIWMSKIGMFDDKPPQQSEAARWGNLLETTVADEWALREGQKYVHIPVILQHDEEPWLLANIDGFTLTENGYGVTGILEIKTTSAYNNDVWEQGPVPFHYVCQTNWYCGITGLNKYTIVCLVGGQKLYHYTLPADPELFERERKAAKTFWVHNVLEKVEPEATAVDKELIARDEKENPPLESLQEAIMDDEETERITEAYCQMREKIKQFNDVKDALYAQIKLKMGNYGGIITKTHTVALKQSNRRSCNFALLQELSPQIYDQVVSHSTTISLDIK